MFARFELFILPTIDICDVSRKKPIDKTGLSGCKKGRVHHRPAFKICSRV
jgi:hypothetical protein